MTHATVPVRLTPLTAWAEAHGAQFTDVAGWRCAERYTAPEAEAAAARQGVALADVSPYGKLLVEGDRAPDIIHAAFGGAPPAVGEGWPGQAEQVYSLRPDLFYGLTAPGGEAQASERLERARAAQGAFVTITDLTHALAAMYLAGPHSRSVLRKVCALSFEPAAFPNLAIRATSLARTRHVILRRDLGPSPAFMLLAAPSLAGYVWEVLLEAGREFGITPLGWAALGRLETTTAGHA